jgi:hypothetical protein
LVINLLVDSVFCSGTIKLNISRLRSETRVGCSKWEIESCVHEAEEELRLGEMVLRSGGSSIPPTATDALTAVIKKMVTAAGDRGYYLANATRCGDVGTVATVAAATAVYRQELVACDPAVRTFTWLLCLQYCGIVFVRVLMLSRLAINGSSVLQQLEKVRA